MTLLDTHGCGAALQAVGTAKPVNAQLSPSAIMHSGDACPLK